MRGVDREHDPLPRHRRLEHDGRAGHLAAEGVALHHRAALDAGQVPVPHLLHAREPLALRALEADELGRELAVRVEAQAVLHQRERGILQVAHRARHVRGEAPPHRGELLRHRELAGDVARGLAQDRGQARREPARVLHLHRRDVERVGAGGDREGLPAAVEDRPALGPERHRLGVLVLGEPGVLVVLPDLQVGQAAEESDEGEGQARREDQRPGSQALDADLGHAVPLAHSDVTRYRRARPPPTADRARPRPGRPGRTRGRGGPGRARAPPCRARCGPCPRCARAT